VAFLLSDLPCRSNGAAVTYQGGVAEDAGRPKAQVKQAASMAKLYATEAAVTATRIATRCSAATASWRSSRWPGSTGTPRSPRSARDL